MILFSIISESDKIGFGNKNMCLQKKNPKENQTKTRRSLFLELNGEEIWKCRRFKFVPNNFCLTKPKLLTAVRLCFILLLETVIQIALSAY